MTGALALAIHAQVENTQRAQEVGSRRAVGQQACVEPHLLFPRAASAVADWEKEAPLLPDLSKISRATKNVDVLYPPCF